MKILPQSEIWFPFLEAALTKNLAEPYKGWALTFSPTPKWYTQDDVVVKQLTAVSLKGTYQKILNRALLYEAPPETLPTHILMIGDGTYDEKVVDQDFSDLRFEYESRDYKFPEVRYVNSNALEDYETLMDICRSEESIQEKIEKFLSPDFVVEAAEIAEAPVVKKRQRKTS